MIHQQLSAFILHRGSSGAATTPSTQKKMHHAHQPPFAIVHNQHGPSGDFPQTSPTMAPGKTAVAAWRSPHPPKTKIISCPPISARYHRTHRHGSGGELLQTSPSTYRHQARPLHATDSRAFLHNDHPGPFWYLHQTVVL